MEVVEKKLGDQSSNQTHEKIKAGKTETFVIEEGRKSILKIT